MHTKGALYSAKLQSGCRKYEKGTLSITAGALPQEDSIYKQPTGTSTLALLLTLLPYHFFPLQKLIVVSVCSLLVTTRYFNPYYCWPNCWPTTAIYPEPLGFPGLPHCHMLQNSHTSQSSTRIPHGEGNGQDLSHCAPSPTEYICMCPQVAPLSPTDTAGAILT